MLDDFTTAPIEEPLRATLGFLKKLTLEPGAVGPDDARAVLRHGMSKDKLADAVHIAALFNIYDRLADTLGWDLPPQAAFDGAAKFLLKRGYDL